MNFPFEWIPGGDWRSKPAQVLALEIDPKYVSPAISVQPEWNKGLGIIRGRKGQNGKLIEDHICERPTPHGQLVDIGKAIFGADNIRKGVWTVEEHLLRYSSIHRDQSILGWVGNGNLLNNPHFVAFVRYSDREQLFHLKSEEPLLKVRDGWRYSCLVVKREGYQAKVSIENLHFKYQKGLPRVFSAIDETDVTDEIEYATFGQRLIDNGQLLDVDQLCDMAKNEQFYDLRHLLLFGRLPFGEKRWMDAGLAAFWNQEGRLKDKELVAAIKGEPISLNVSQFSEKDVVKALLDKGYKRSENVSKQGHFKLEKGELTIVFRYGIYPHNMIGIRKDGKLLSVVIRGLSNRVGVTIFGASKIMKMLGAEDALLIDNGGDVMMSFGDEIALGSAEGERKKLKSMILFVARKDQKEEIGPACFKHIIFPRQYYSE